jgi:type II secretory pathway component PulF
LSYPVVVLFTAFLAILFMLQFVVPMFADIFKQQKVELPWITKVILNASDGFKEYWWIGFLLILIIVISIKVFKDKNWYQKYKAIAIL